MPSRFHDQAAFLERIEQVENGLLPAICIKGEPPLRKNLEAQMKEMKVPAASIAVINNGQVEWAKAYGVLSTNDSQTADTKTLFQAGSVSKPVAAFAMLTLVQKGVVNLDEDVNQKLISWKIPENEFTAVKKVALRHLLSHSSGFNVIGFDGYKRSDPIPTITQTLDGLKPANNPPIRVEFVPFSKMSYSGGGFNVAQQLVEDVTQMSFAQFMKTILLDPLEMKESTFDFLDFDTPNVALAHPTHGEPMEGGWKSYPESAAAGLWTTPHDLAKWLIQIQESLTEKNSGVLNKDLSDQMVTPQVAVHGLGPMINGEGDKLELSYKGRTDGFTCGFVSFPYLKQGAVVMINAGNEAAFVDCVLRSVASAYNWPSYSVKIKETMDLAPQDMEKYVGRYGWGEKENDIYDLFVSKENGELFLKMGNASYLYRLYPEAKNRFFLLDIGYDIVFNEVDGSITNLTIIVQPGFEREFTKF